MTRIYNDWLKSLNEIDTMRDCPRCGATPCLDECLNGAVSVYCERCKAHGAYGTSQAEAVRFWNYDVMDETEEYRQPSL